MKLTEAQQDRMQEEFPNISALITTESTYKVAGCSQIFTNYNNAIKIASEQLFRQEVEKFSDKSGRFRVNDFIVYVTGLHENEQNELIAWFEPLTKEDKYE